MVRDFFSRVFGSSSSGVAEYSGNSSDGASSIGERLGDHVYLLRPRTNPGIDPEIDVVFFHGLPKNKEDTAETFWKTWTMRNNPGDCWPITLLPERIKNSKKRRDDDPLGYDPRVLAVSWNNKVELPRVLGTEETDPFILTENLVRDLILSDDVGAGQDRPVILVGHDLGGILIKQLILFVENRAAIATSEVERVKLNRFLDNLGSVFFYDTPHSGSAAIQTLAKSISEESRNQMLQFMHVLGSDMARINSNFTAYRNNEKNKQRFTTFALYATHLTNQGYFKNEKVCVEGAARNDIDTFFSVAGDHYQVCQPEHPNSSSVIMLRDRIVEVVNAHRDMKEKIEEENLEARLGHLVEFGKKLEENNEVASTSSETSVHHARENQTDYVHFGL